jgi:hypothetical protein
VQTFTQSHVLRVRVMAPWRLQPSRSSESHSPSASSAVTMLQISPEKPAHANYQSIFDSALQAYKTKTRKDILSHPLFHEFESCNSPDDIITTMQQQIPGFDQSASGSSDDRFTRWLDPTVKVISAFSVTIGGALALVGVTDDEVTCAVSAY